MWKGGKGLTGVSKRTLYRVWAPKKDTEILKVWGQAPKKHPFHLA